MVAIAIAIAIARTWSPYPPASDRSRLLQMWSSHDLHLHHHRYILSNLLAMAASRHQIASVFFKCGLLTIYHLHHHLSSNLISSPWLLPGIRSLPSSSNVVFSRSTIAIIVYLAI
jgi:hypothetical protein